MSSVVEGTTSLDVTRHQCVSAMICDRLIGVSQFVNYKCLPALQVFAIFSNKEEWQQVIHQMTQGEGRKEGNVLFNDAINTFYLWSYGIRHMVKDHSESKSGNPLPPHRLFFPINSKGSFICTIPQTG